ncbi:MAG: hypothetical protein Q7S65_02770 [Nanoarchaeota archaeon]|nr:hypothetical protein [Nanoarchaeota archaeon]
MKLQSVLISLAVIALLVVIFYPWKEQEYHAHADFRVVVNGERLDFGQEKYMTEGSFLLSKYVHLHDNDGDVIHVHNNEVALGDFFASLKFKLNKTCLITDMNLTYCTGDGKALQMFVNGKETPAFHTYEPHDLDRILIIYGNGSDIEKEINLVTDKACIQSGTCPERGAAYNESLSCGPGSFCVG